MIEGRLRLDTWEDKQTNQKRSKLGVVLKDSTPDFRNREGVPTGAPSPPPCTTPLRLPLPACVRKRRRPSGDDVPF